METLTVSERSIGPTLMAKSTKVTGQRGQCMEEENWHYARERSTSENLRMVSQMVEVLGNGKTEISMKVTTSMGSSKA